MWEQRERVHSLKGREGVAAASGSDPVRAHLASRNLRKDLWLSGERRAAVAIEEGGANEGEGAAVPICSEAAL